MVRMKHEIKYELIRDNVKDNSDDWGYWRLEPYIVFVFKKNKFIARNLKLKK